MQEIAKKLKISILISILSHLFTVDVEAGVLWVLFNEAASWGQSFVNQFVTTYWRSGFANDAQLPRDNSLWSAPSCHVDIYFQVCI